MRALDRIMYGDSDFVQKVAIEAKKPSKLCLAIREHLSRLDWRQTKLDAEAKIPMGTTSVTITGRRPLSNKFIEKISVAMNLTQKEIAELEALKPDHDKHFGLMGRKSRK